MTTLGRRGLCRTKWLACASACLAFACGQATRQHDPSETPDGTTGNGGAGTTTRASTGSTNVGGESAGAPSDTDAGGVGGDAGGVGGGVAGAPSGECECLSDAHCTTLICNDGWCEPPRCFDGVRNGSETDIDCGGAACEPCARGAGCTPGDCAEGALCVCGVCEPAPPAGEPSCRDGVKNGDETAIDCGGDQCPDCSEAWCCSEADCPSRVCDHNRCQPATCQDAVQNGSEADVDCGGESCEPCPPDSKCTTDLDCETGACREVLSRSETCGPVVVCIDVP